MSGQGDMLGAPKPSDVSVERAQRCIERELSLRERKYPDWVRDRRMTQRLADEEILAMRRVLEIVVQQRHLLSMLDDMTLSGGCINCDRGIVYKEGDYGARHGWEHHDCAFGQLLKRFDDLCDVARDVLADFEAPSHEGRISGSTYERLRALVPKRDL